MISQVCAVLKLWSLGMGGGGNMEGENGGGGDFKSRRSVAGFQCLSAAHSSCQSSAEIERILHPGL